MEQFKTLICELFRNYKLLKFDRVTVPYPRVRARVRAGGRVYRLYTIGIPPSV